MQRRFIPWLLLSLLFAAGCGTRTASINKEEDFVIQDVDVDKNWEFGAKSKDTKISVLLRAAGVKLDVYVALASEYPALQDQLTKQVAVTTKVLAKKEQITEGQLEATVPAGQKFYVVVARQTTKTVKASIKITSG